MATHPVHSGDDLTVYKMVLNRLPFLEDSINNEELVSNFTLEVMHELNTCFSVDEVGVGDEAEYTILQKSIIADIVSCYILIIQMLANSGGVSSTNETVEPGSNKVLTEAEAGSVSVKWAQFDSKSGNSLNMPAQSLLSRYKKGAMRKAHTLGCIIDICDDCSIAVGMINSKMPAMFKVVTDNYYGPGDINERG